MTENAPEARAACEHVYASHCHRGMSVRLCLMCHGPDWDDLERQLGREPADGTDDAGGRWSCISFVGHNEYTGYVREIVKAGQPAYRVDLPGLVYGGNPLDYVEYAASAWFSEWPVTEASVRAAWEAGLRAAEERRRREAEWDRLQQQRALTAGSADDDPDDEAWSSRDD